MLIHAFFKHVVVGAVAAAAFGHLAAHAQSQVDPDSIPDTPAVDADSEIVLSICDQNREIVIHVPSASKAEAQALIGDLIVDHARHGQYLCAQQAPIPQAWVLEGTPRSMLVGVLPMGMAGDLYIQRYSPFELVGPVTVSVVDNQ